MHNCEFCEEFAGRSPRFENLYGKLASTRIIARTEHFVVIPTLGQLFPGSLLLLPVDHVETCSSLAADARRELEELAAEMTLRVRKFGEPIVFEHGATEPTGGGCGIYHAHLHIVPAPELTFATELFPEHQGYAHGLLDAWEALKDAPEYLLIGAAGQTLYRIIDKDADNFPSQFFRRRIAEHFDLKAPWDWRAYTDVEPSLLKTLGLASLAHAR